MLTAYLLREQMQRRCKEARGGTRRRTGEEANKQECKEECAREKIWLVETFQIFLNVGFNIGFY